MPGTILDFIADVEQDLCRALSAQSKSVFHVFFRINKPNKKIENQVSLLFMDLYAQPFSHIALLGALCLIQQQSVMMLEARPRNAIVQKIGRYLAENSIDRKNMTYCMQSFRSQAAHFDVQWPAASTIVHTKKELVMD